jgi:hypothetical protein
VTSSSKGIFPRGHEVPGLWPDVHLPGIQEEETGIKMASAHSVSQEPQMEPDANSELGRDVVRVAVQVCCFCS